MSRGKDSVILYQSFFDATAGLKAAAKAELWDCIGKYLNGGQHKFKDSSAELAWNFIVRQLDADRVKYDERCRKNRENGNRGGRPTKKQKDKTESFENPKKPNGFPENQNKPNGFFQNPTDTDSDTDSDKRKNIDKKENSDFSLDDFLEAAKLPDVAVKPEQARECFYFYIVQVFVKYHINITQINSKMMNNSAEEQAVFIDFDGHKDDEIIKNLISDLEPQAKSVRIIGSYAKF